MAGARCLLLGGQRRGQERVQLLLDRERTLRVILLDEVTAELDVLARADLLGFLRAESEAGAAVLYASHVLDGLEEFATHALGAAPAGPIGSALHRLCEAWMREDGVAP